LTDDLAAG
jgi:hypothetical protein